MGNTFYFEWEVGLMAWIQSWIGSFGTAIASFFTMFGEQLVCILVLGFLYWCWDKEFGKYVGLNVLAVNIFNPMLKNVFIRRRPYFDHTDVQCLRPVKSGADIYDISAQGYSFPSGHSSNSVALFGSLARYAKKRWLAVIGVVLPLLVGVSRFALGVHYPTDVLCGWALGTAVIVIIPMLQKMIKNRRIFYAVLVAVSIPGWFYCRSEDFYTGFGLLIGFIIGSEFESKYVRFSNTRNVIRIILRIIGGAASYFALNMLLKLPFDKAFLDSASLAAYAVRTLRYTIIVFLIIGVYPLLFRIGDRIFQRKQ